MAWVLRQEEKEPRHRQGALGVVLWEGPWPSPVGRTPGQAMSRENPGLQPACQSIGAHVVLESVYLSFRVLVRPTSRSAQNGCQLTQIQMFSDASAH